MRLRNSVLAEVLLIALVYGVGVLFNWRRNAAMDLPTWYGMTVTGNCNRADAEVEGHHVQFVRGSEFGHLRCGDRPVVSGATARQDEREAGQGDSPGQRFGLHRLFFLTSARCTRNQSPVG